jgi:hypothetical protein
MAVRTVVDPDGRTWRIRRKWLSRSLSWRGPRDLTPPGPDLLDAGLLADDLGCLPAIGVVVTAAVAMALAVFFVLPAIVFAVELVAVLLLLLLGALARIVLRRPWTVEARLKGTNQGREWKVVGWRASGELVETMADRIRSTGRVGDVSWTG